jgi:hypothetical protein
LWKYLYTNYIFNLIDIYIYIPANGCIGSRLVVLLCPGTYDAVKTALSRLAFPRFTKHIQNNVTQDSFLFNQDLINLNIPSVSSGSSSRYENVLGHYKKVTFYFVKNEMWGE